MATFKKRTVTEAIDILLKIGFAFDRVYYGSSPHTETIYQFAVFVKGKTQVHIPTSANYLFDMDEIVLLY